MHEYGAKTGNIPDPNLFPAVSEALESMGIDIAEGAADKNIDDLIKSLFALSAQALQTAQVADAIAEFITKPEEE